MSLRTVRLHGDPVGPCLPEDRVSTSAALQEVAAGTALDPIVPTAAADRVGAGRSDEPVRTVGACQLCRLRGSQHHECDEHGERRTRSAARGCILATSVMSSPPV